MKRFYHPERDDAVPQSINPPSDLVFIQGGQFSMGSNEWNGTKPIHKVNLTSFYLAPTPVTQEQWESVMGYQVGGLQDKKAPAAMVSWSEAIEYCNKLSQKEGLRPCYSKAREGIICDWSAEGYRLPTEAEWEYAARGGMFSKDTRYSGSNDIDLVAWFGENSQDHAHPVALKQPNALNIYDLSGNVREWCWDWQARYPSDLQTDPHGPDTGTSKIVRGGSYTDAAYFCTVFVRAAQEPGDKYLNFGFRVLRFMR